MYDTRFWNSVEKVEQEAFADLDFARFRRRMKRKGFDADVIAEREQSIRDDYKMIFGVVLDA